MGPLRNDGYGRSLPLRRELQDNAERRADYRLQRLRTNSVFRRQRPIRAGPGHQWTFYGTTYFGGVHGYGTIFSLSTGQAPFVETRPTLGAVGKVVTILGYKLAGTTSVTFNGEPAAFIVHSATDITTTVPAGATTGKVEVITPEGTLASNVNFRIP
jgi:uncharacterized repeat protein (TIGR03803 family)